MPAQNPKAPRIVNGEARRLVPNNPPSFIPNPRSFFVGGFGDNEATVGSAPPPVQTEAPFTFEQIFDGAKPGQVNPPAPNVMMDPGAMGTAGADVTLIQNRKGPAQAKREMTQQEKIIAVLAAGIAGYYVYNWKGPAFGVAAAAAGYFAAQKIQLP